MRNLYLAVAFCFAIPVCSAQTDSVQTNWAPNVFFSCNTCPERYIKEQMPYLNYVRDRKVADVQVLGTVQRAGSGGRQGTLVFTGRLRFSGMNDTLTFNTSPDNTEQEVRDIKLRTFQLGMVRYMIRTPLGDHFTVNYTEPLDKAVVEDKWNNWVFRLGTNGYFNGQQTYNSLSVSGSVSVDKVTEDWKVEFDADAHYSEDRFEIDDETITGISRSQRAGGALIRSLSDHWSFGFFAGANASVFSNLKLGLRAAAAIEFNLFPYSKSTRRQLRISYRPGFERVSYNDTTIHNKLEESLVAQSLGVAFSMTENWGSVSASVSGSNYFHDFSKNALNLSGNLNLRIAKGLSLSFGGGYSFIRDQLALEKTGASDEDVLLRLKEIETAFNYWGHFGLSYTFGSIYNTIVNPRFGGGGASRIVFQ